MDREIKFRAWLRKYEKMVDVKRINFDVKNVECYLVSKNECNLSEFVFNEVELMQYTGIKDKNGKQIYEGDIVSEEHPESNHEPFDQIPDSIRGVVKFERGKFIVPAKVNYGVEKRNLHAVKGVAVVGNIYENPELLDKLNDK
jgi:uncharacterized phage protein (TIGR01671 family)